MTTNPPPASGPGFLPQRTLLILLTALTIGFMFGLCAYGVSGNVLIALPTGVSVAGCSTIGLHTLID